MSVYLESYRQLGLADFIQSACDVPIMKVQEYSLDNIVKVELFAGL